MTRKKDWQVAEQSTVTSILRNAVAAAPDKKFVRMPDGELTYREFDQRSNALARGLLALGVKPGDTVTTMLDSNLDCVLFWFAINKIGAIWVPINTAYKGEFLRHLVVDSASSVFVAESDYVDRLQLIENAIPQVQQLFFRGQEPASTFSRLEPKPLQWLYSADSTSIETAVAADSLSMLIYTGGTTGPSKGCMISHNYACNLARQAVMMTGRTSEDIAWSCLPFFHFNATAFTLLSTAMTAGSCVFTHRFSLSNFWRSIEESGATIANVLGTMIPLIATAPDEAAMKRCYGQVRVVTGAPFPAELQTIWKERFGVKIAGTPGYGFTEATMLTSLAAGEYFKPGSSGKRNEWFDVRIFDDNHRELPPGEAGEIVARPLQPNVMFQGYWNRPADTLKIMSDLWLHTGDIGKFDEDGYFFFVDRKKDYLRRGGENISSYEMETALSLHPDVEDVAVHAVFSELSEDEVKATVVRREGATLTEKELFVWLVDCVPYFALPRYIEFRAELPKSPLGRVLKYQLRDEGCTPATWDRNTAGIEYKKR